MKNTELNVKKSYVAESLNSFLNEGNSVVLKRKYGERSSVVVGTKAPVRNQILSFVYENKIVSKGKLAEFIKGINEGKDRPAATNMWIKRNSKYFIMESRNGKTYFKLSDLGKRIVNKFNLTPNVQLSEGSGCNCGNAKPTSISRPRYINEFEDFDEDDDMDIEMRERDFDDHMDIEMRERDFDDHMDIEMRERDFDDDPELEAILAKAKQLDYDDDYDIDAYERDDETLNDEEINSFNQMERPTKNRQYDFIDKGRTGIYDMDENCNVNEEDEDIEEMENEEELVETIKINKNKLKSLINKLNEEVEEGEEVDNEDELSFDDIKLDDEESDSENEEDVEEEVEENLEDEEEQVEITEFIITVDNVDEALTELSELEIDATKNLDEEGEEIEGQIKVSADNIEALRDWLKEKGVDLEEMLGGELNVEDDLENEELPIDNEEEELEGLNDLEGSELDDSDEEKDIKEV